MPIINKNENKQFHDFFAPMMKNIERLKLVSHIGSFFTQVFVIVLLMRTNLPIEIKWLCTLTSLIIGIFIGGIIEVGLSKFLPFTVKQLLGWEFHNNWFKAMFWAVSLCIVAPLLLASPTLSGIGGNEIVDRLMSGTERPNTDNLDNRLTLKLSELDSIKGVEQQILAISYNKLKDPIKNKYASLIQIQKNKYQKYKKVYNTPKGKWAIDHMRKATDKIESLNVSMSDALSPIVTEEKDKLDELNQKYNQEKTYYRDEKDNQVNTITGDWEKAQTKRDYRAWVWGNILGALAVFFALGTVVCIIIIGIFQMGSGDEIKAATDEPKSGNFIQNLMEDISGKVADYLPTGKAANIEPAMRQIGFNKSGNQPTPKAANIELEITNKAANIKAATPPKSGKVPRKFAALPPPNPKAANFKAANTKAANKGEKVAAKNRQTVQQTKRQIAAKNSGKVTQKEVAAITTLSIRTVRKYWKNTEG